MPNVAGLTILLGADFTSAEQAMDAFNGKVSQFVQQMQTLFASAGVNIKDFQKNLVSLTATQKQLTAALKDGNDEVRKLGDTTIKINDYTKQLTSGVTNLGYTMTRTIHGFAELFVRPGQALLILSNDIPQLVTRLREAQQAGNSFGSIMAEAFDPMVLAIQLGLTAILRYAPEIYKWATGADVAAQKAKALKEQQDALTNAFNSGVSKVADNIAQVQELSAQMLDGNRSLSDRKDVYNQLIALYPQLSAVTGGAIKDLDTEKDGVNKLKTAIDELTDSLFKKAVAEGFASQAKKIAENAALAYSSIDDLQKKYTKAYDTLQKTPKVILSGADVERGNVTFDEIKQAKAYEAAQKNVNDAQQAYLSKWGEFYGAQAKSNELFKLSAQFADDAASSVLQNASAYDKLKHQLDALQSTRKIIDPSDTKALADNQKQIDAVQLQLDKYDTKTKSAGDSSKRLSKAQNDLNASLKETAAQLKAGNITDYEAATQNLQAYQKDLSSLFKNGGSQSAIDRDIQKIKELNSTISNAHWKDALGSQADYLNNQQILVQVGGQTQLEALRNDLGKAKQTLNEMVTGNYKLPLDSDEVKQAQQNIADLQGQIDAITRNQKIADVFGDLNNQTAALKQELQANLISPLEYARQDADNVNAAIKKLLNQNVGASGSWIQNLQNRKGNDNALVKQFEDAQKQEKIFSDQFESSVQTWNRIIDQPIKTFIDDLVEGKNVAKDFGKAVIKVFEEIGAKLLESGLISLFTDGSESAKALSKQTGKSNFQNVWDYLNGGSKAIENSINQNKNSLASMFGDNVGWLFGNNTGAAPKSSDYGQPNYDKSKAIGDDAKKQLSVLDNATINNTIVGGKTKSTESGVLSTLGSIASLIPGWGLASGLLKGIGSVIPYLADGGIATGPTLAMIGEAGKEAVIPLDKLNQFTGNTKNLNVNVRGVATGRDLSIVGTNYDEFSER